MGEAVMSSKPRSRSVKRRRRNTAKGARFNPIAYLATAAKGRVISTHPKKQIIFAQGDAADSVHYIQAGKVKVTIVSPGGKEAIVAILGPDEFFGEGCLIGQPKRLAIATAMTDALPSSVGRRHLNIP